MLPHTLWAATCQEETISALALADLRLKEIVGEHLAEFTYARVTGVGFQVPSSSEGGRSFGQYNRNVSTNGPFCAGNHFDSFSGPGLAAWMYSATVPSESAFKALRWLSV